MPTTSNFGWTTPADTDLVKDGAAAIRTLGNGIDTSFLDLKGGTTGQVLSKNSNTDLDFIWVAQDDSNAIQNAIVDAKGDLISATAADTPARLAVGANGTVLTADSAESTGLKWATPAGGKLLQVVNANITTSTTISTTTQTDTNITATITPTSASSKILVLINAKCLMGRNFHTAAIGGRIMRGATVVMDYGDQMLEYLEITDTNTEAQHSMIHSLNYYDSPATTSATTYKLQAKIPDTNNSAYSVWNGNGVSSQITLMEIGA